MSTPQEKLAQAEEALHQLMLGKATVTLSYGERRVDYTQADRAALQTYIAQLQRQVAGRPARRGRLTYMVPH